MLCPRELWQNYKCSLKGRSQRKNVILKGKTPKVSHFLQCFLNQIQKLRIICNFWSAWWLDFQKWLMVLIVFDGRRVLLTHFALCSNKTKTLHRSTVSVTAERFISVVHNRRWCIHTFRADNFLGYFCVCCRLCWDSENVGVSAHYTVYHLPLPPPHPQICPLSMFRCTVNQTCKCFVWKN